MIRPARRRERGAHTPVTLLKGIGRAVLWGLVAVLLVRGAADLGTRSEPAAADRGKPAAPPAWPDDEARAFALDFARTYLAASPRNPEAYAQALRAYVTPDLTQSIVPERPEDAPREAVGAAAVARIARIDGRHALLTVATDGGRYLTVPVARDAAGGLVVYDLPSLAAPPAHAQATTATLDPLSGSEQDEIRDVATRFLRAHLAGDARQLAYFVPAGVRMGALARPHELVGPVTLAQPAATTLTARSRVVVATVQARDEASRTVFSLRYRLRLVRSDRWLVSELNEATPKEG